jgi:hypothetical protein
LYSKFENLGTALQYAYLEIEWEFEKFSQRGKKSIQRWLRVMIEELVPGVDIVEDYLHPDLVWGMSLAEFVVYYYSLLCILLCVIFVLY